ncbi:MAG: hypothetical protein C4567_02375 [Deltaproteobacteria bacterium]|nr:MAG: hypothetical protein C4567_02375 [Deltaproteobacteria bacterium]
MTLYIILIAAAIMLGIVFIFKALTSWGDNWGATAAECAAAMTGDAYLAGGPKARVVMTRAVSISRPPEVVWPWLAQLGRGAGYYSIDGLDNGGKTSARHLVSWIPEPQLGDAAAIGYLRYLEPGRELVWWLGGLQAWGARFRMVNDLLLTPAAGGSRLVIRISGDAAGPLAPLALGFFQVVDAVMARRQLLGIKERAEGYGARAADPDHPENGADDQYQFYEAIYASGRTAGVRGREQAAYWRQMAIEDKIIIDSHP